MQKKTLDDRKFDAAIDLVKANANWHRVMEEYGAMSQESRDALEHAEKTLRRFRRLANQHENPARSNI